MEVSLFARAAKCIRNDFMSKIGRTIFLRKKIGGTFLDKGTKYALEMRIIGSISHDGY